MSRIEIEQEIVNRELSLSHSFSSLEALKRLPENVYREQMTHVVASRIHTLSGDIEGLKRELSVAS
jgi:hypothetical protein